VKHTRSKRAGHIARFVLSNNLGVHAPCFSYNHIYMFLCRFYLDQRGLEGVVKSKCL
jgi:hypothetical protein